MQLVGALWLYFKVLARPWPFCPMAERSLRTCGFIVKMWDSCKNCNLQRNRTKQIYIVFWYFPSVKTPQRTGLETRCSWLTRQSGCLVLMHCEWIPFAFVYTAVHSINWASCLCRITTKKRGKKVSVDPPCVDLHMFVSRNQIIASKHLQSWDDTFFSALTSVQS